MNQMSKDFIFASSLLANTIIGAGIFSLPFVFHIVGLGYGLLCLLSFAALYSALHLMYAHILQTGEKNHRFAYFAEKYLGQGLGRVVAGFVLIELLLVLTVYLILAPSFFSILFGISGGAAILLFWALGSFFIFLNLEELGWVAALSLFSIFAIVAIVFQYSVFHELTTPLFKQMDIITIMLPFGPLLFALNGRPGISKVVDIWRRVKDSTKPFLLRNAIIAGTSVSALIYLLFVVSVLKLSPIPTEDTILGLLGTIPPWTLVCLGALGLLAIWTSYFMIGANIRDILHGDLHFSGITSAFFVLFVPPALYFLGVSQFIKAISFVGGVLLSFEGIFIVMMWRRAFPKSRLHRVSLVLYLVFLCAIIYQVAQFFI